MKRQSCRSCRSPLELCSMWSLRVTSFAQQARKRSVHQKCQRQKIMSTFDSVQDRDLLPVYTVKSRNEPISANTNRLKSSNSLCHRAKPKHLEADAATGSWTCDNQRPVGRLDADTSWSETLFLRYSSVTKRLIRLLFFMLGMRTGMTVWCTLIHWDWCICPTACS